MSPERKFYVYAHYRKSDGRVFYIGKGQGNRMHTHQGRSLYWTRIVEKHGKKSHKIMASIPEACAFSLERALISIHRNSLCNITDGGEGVSGLKHSDESRRKMSENHNRDYTPYWTGKKMPSSLKAKFREAKLGKAQSPSHAAKSRTAKLGKPQPQSARDFMRKLKSKPIVSSAGEWFPSAAEAARVLSKRLGVKCSQGNISMVATGSRNMAYGLGWSYVA